MTIRVDILVDNPTIWLKLVELINQQPDMTMIVGAQDSDRALEMVRHGQTDVVVMGQGGSDIQRIETACSMVIQQPGLQLILLNMQTDSRYIQKCFSCGVAGYVLEDCAYEELPIAIRTVSEGGQYLSHDISITIS